jgi:hypothetical protein
MVVKNRYGVIVNNKIPITGVICNHSIPYLHEMMIDGIDLVFEEHVAVCGGQCKRCGCSHEGGRSEGGEHLCECMGLECTEYAPTHEHDRCGPESFGGEVLIGSWEKDRKEGLYRPDRKGEFAAIVGVTYTQVVWSRATKKVNLCSPCYPGQGDLDTVGEFLAYDLPEDAKEPA